MLKEGKLYYSISEVAKHFNVNASLLRFWEKEFDFILKPKKNKKGNRYYTPEDVKNIETIYFLVKQSGFTLEGAKAKLKVGTEKVVEQKEIIEKLQAIRNELKSIADDL
jgi:DNA-binding transcriptional MerR regulator